MRLHDACIYFFVPRQGGTRTPDTVVRSHILYPTELLALVKEHSKKGGTCIKNYCSVGRLCRASVSGVCERGRLHACVLAVGILIYGRVVFAPLLKHIKESLILAQKERWQRA
jgi:hypothetical protein